MLKEFEYNIRHRIYKLRYRLKGIAYKFYLALNRKRVFGCGQKVSIIVPVYNTSKYLRECMDCILKQTYKNIEVVCVNDCSTDNSLTILKEYALKDSRVVIVDKPVNEGPSYARKTGLANSSGQWIMMIDSDDWIEKNMVESLLGIAVLGGYDMTCCDMICYRRDGVITISTRHIPQDKLTRIKKITIGNENHGGCLVYKFVKKEIYDKIEFPTENVCEDQYVSCQLFYYTDTIMRVPLPLYHYRFNENSLTNNPQNAQLKYLNIKSVYERIFGFCRKRYGDDLSVFEPELSWRRAWIEDINPQKDGEI